MRRLLIDISPDGFTITGLVPGDPMRIDPPDEAGHIAAYLCPTTAEEMRDENVGVLASGRSFGDLLRILSQQISQATGDTVILEAKTSS